MRDKIFVCYSHDDADWQGKFQKALGSGIYAEAVELWSDCDIQPSAEWQAKIDDAISSSRVALLLVSRNFLRSDFIIRHELPAILKRDQRNALSIWWVPLETVTDDELARAHLNSKQAAWPLSKPLSELDGKERTAAIDNISAMLIKQFGSIADISKAARDEIAIAVERAVGDGTTIMGPVEPGDYSIIYRAKRRDADVAVKALVPSRREWLAKDFIDRAQLVRNITNETAIGIRDVIDFGIKCVVMEYVEAPTLKNRIKNSAEGLPAPQVADILAQLAEVASDLRRIDPETIIGPIRPSHVHCGEAGKVRISLVHIANETLKSCIQRPTSIIDDDALTYLSPERYEGRNVDIRTDQYYLGLLGLELLQGKPPVPVASFADLETKTRFFKSPRAFFGNLPTRSPALSFVLAKMLERAPEDRWASMTELMGALREIADGRVPRAIRQRVTSDYRQYLHGSEDFFRAFYEALLGASPEIRTLFEQRASSMAEQYRKLDMAINSLFYFDSSIEATSLDIHVESHRAYGLKPEYFDLFGAAFLKALHDTQKMDAYSEEAWRAILDPALTYMREKTCSSGLKAAE